MVRDSGLVVELVEVGMLLVLVVWVAQLRARRRRMARDLNALSLTVAAVETWAVQEIRALRDQTRVDASALVVLEQIQQQARLPTPARAPAPNDEPQARRELVAPSERAALEPEPEQTPEPAAEDEPRDTLAMPAPHAPKPSDEDGDETVFLDREPTPATWRVPIMRPPAPSAPPDQRAPEDLAEEASSSGLGPDDPTPLGYERAALVPPGQGPTEESA